MGEDGGEGKVKLAVLIGLGVRVEISCCRAVYSTRLCLHSHIVCSCRPHTESVMPSLLLIVFFLQLSIHLVNTVGAPVINEFVPIVFLTIA